MEEASRLLLEACHQFRDAVADLRGPLERDVENAAARCWEIREKTVQLKARLFRTKTLILEDCIFSNDREREFGEILAKWEETGAHAALAEAVEVRAAEQRLVFASTNALQPNTLLPALSAVLDVLDGIVVDVTIQDFLPQTISLVTSVAQQLGLAYVESCRAAGQNKLSSSELARIFAVHPSATDCMLGLINDPEPAEVVSMLRSLAPISLSAEFLLQFLSQCRINEISGEDAAVLPRVLNQLNVANETANPSSVSAKHVASVLQSLAVQAGGISPSAGAFAADALLQRLLAASKGIATAELDRIQAARDTIQPGLGNPLEETGLAPLDIPTLADWVFSSPAEDGTSVDVVVTLLENLPWEWLSSICPSNLRLRWIIGIVSACKAVVRLGNSDLSKQVTEFIAGQLSGPFGWQLAQGDLIKGNGADDAYTLCMLEPPSTERHAVQLMWRLVQASTGLSLCCHWLATIADDKEAADKVRTLLEGAQINEGLQSLIQAGWGKYVILLCADVVATAGSNPRFHVLLGSLLVDLLVASVELENDIREVLEPVIKSVFGALWQPDLLATQESTSDSENKLNAATAWLGLLSGVLLNDPRFAEHQNLPVMQLLERLTCAVYSLVGTPTDDGATIWVSRLAMSLVPATRGIPQQRVDETFGRLMASNQTWQRVLATWIADAAGIHGVLTLENVRKSFHAELPDDRTQYVAMEVLALQEVLLSQGSSKAGSREDLNTDLATTTILWYELCYRISRHPDALLPIINQRDLKTALARTIRSVHSRSEAAATVVVHLVGLITEGRLAADTQLLPFVGAISVVKELGQGLPLPPLEADFHQLVEEPSSKAAGLVPSVNVSLPPRRPPPDPAALGFVVCRQQGQGSRLADATTSLRAWTRRIEKAAARGPGEEIDPGEGREGDVPESLAAAQRLLWEGEQRLSEQLSSLNGTLRQRVCQQYLPVDEQYLQETSDMYSDGQRIPRQLRDPRHNAACRDLRAEAFSATLAMVDSKEVTTAAYELFTTEYLLLNNFLSVGSSASERTAVRSKLLAVVAESLVDGSTPQTAVPFLTGLYERAVAGSSGGVVFLDTDAKLRLIPRIAQALAPGSGPGNAPPLREKDGVRLLRASLDPDALLNAGKIRDFATAMTLVGRLCREADGGQAAPMLTSFDSQRFGVLVAERGLVRGGSTVGGASSSSQSRGDAGVSVDEALTISLRFLSHSSTQSTGAALVEGVLGFSADSFYAACLVVALHAPDSALRDNLLRILAQIPVEMLSRPIIVHALEVLTESFIVGDVTAMTCPWELVTVLWRSPLVLNGLRSFTESGRDTSDHNSGKQGDAWTAHIVSPQGQMAPGAATGRARGAGTSRAGETTSAISFGLVSQQQSAVGIEETEVALVPIASPSDRPVALIAEDLLGAILDAVLHALKSGFMSELMACDTFQQVLGTIFDAVGGQEAWGLEWLWGMQRRCLHAFLMAAGPLTGNRTTDVFRQYWNSLPWGKAVFHLKSPPAVATIRTNLCTPYGAAAQLVRSLDWSPIVKGAAGPPPFSPPGRKGSVFTLMDDEERTLPPVASTLLGVSAPVAWAAELGLLLLHVSIFFTSDELPDWVRPQVEGTAPEVVHLLAGADWDVVRRVSTFQNTTDPGRWSSIPWLALPILLSPGSVSGSEVSERIVRASLLLANAAGASGDAAAAAVAVNMIRPLLGLSICQGIQIDQETASVPVDVMLGAPAIASHQLLDLPDDIPEELLEGTVELQELRSQQEARRLMEEDQAEARAAMAQSAMARRNHGNGGTTLQVIETQGCFRLTAAQHATLVRSALGPLARQNCPKDPAALRPQDCIPVLDLEAPSPGGAVQFWESDFGAELSSQHAVGAKQPATTRLDRNTFVAEVLASLLQPLIQRPITILTHDSLISSNAELPWLQEAAVFITAGAEPDADRRRPSRRSLRDLRRQISSLLRGTQPADNSHVSTQSAETKDSMDAEMNRAVTDATGLRNLLTALVEDACKESTAGAHLSACLLRCVVLSAPLHHSSTATLLAEDLLRLLAAPVNADEYHGGSSLVTRPWENSGLAQVPIVAVQDHDVTVTRLDQPAAPSGMEAPHVASPSMKLAAAAAAWREPGDLLRLATIASTLKRPLLCAFAMERARQAATVMDKNGWQSLVVEVLRNARTADSNAEHPLDIVAVWLEALSWLNDSRWRRLPSGPHKTELSSFLAVLDQRVEIVQALTPEGLAGSSHQGAHRNPFVAAADRLRVNASSLLASPHLQDGGVVTQHPSAAQPHHGTFLPPAHHGLSIPNAITESEIEDKGEERHSSLLGQGRRLASGIRNLGRQISGAGGKILHGRTGHEQSETSIQEFEGGYSAPPKSSRFSASGGRGPSYAADAAEIDPERDAILRVGLAAFAVSAYVRSVMDPKLTRRTASGVDPGSPGRYAVMHTRGNSSLTGSRHLEEAQLREMDTIVEAQEQLDGLRALEGAPLLMAWRGRYAAFLERLPSLLTVMTSVPAFQGTIARLLLRGRDADVVVAIVEASVGVGVAPR